jgi:hypothetical protein
VSERRRGGRSSIGAAHHLQGGQLEWSPVPERTSLRTFRANPTEDRNLLLHFTAIHGCSSIRDGYGRVLDEYCKRSPAHQYCANSLWFPVNLHMLSLPQQVGCTSFSPCHCVIYCRKRWDCGIMPPCEMLGRKKGDPEGLTCEGPFLRVLHNR